METARFFIFILWKLQIDNRLTKLNSANIATKKRTTFAELKQSARARVARTDLRGCVRNAAATFRKTARPAQKKAHAVKRTPFKFGNRPTYLRLRYAANAKAIAPKIAAHSAGSGTTAPRLNR